MHSARHRAPLGQSLGSALGWIPCQYIDYAARIEGIGLAQTTSGDWDTPSEYVHELIRQDKERRLGNLEQELIAAAKGPKIELPVAEIRKKGLISTLRERARRR